MQRGRVATGSGQVAGRCHILAADPRTARRGIGLGPRVGKSPGVRGQAPRKACPRPSGAEPARNVLRGAQVPTCNGLGGGQPTSSGRYFRSPLSDAATPPEIHRPRFATLVTATLVISIAIDRAVMFAAVAGQDAGTCGHDVFPLCKRRTARTSGCRAGGPTRGASDIRGMSAPAVGAAATVHGGMTAVTPQLATAS